MKIQKEHYTYLLGIGGVLALWILLSISSYFLLVVPRQYRFDFYPRWEGSRAVLAGENPYSQEISWRIQETVFGRRQGPDEIVQHYVYPATLTWILLPFWILPYPIAISLWLGLQLLLMLFSLLFVTMLLRWRLNSLAFLLLLFFSLMVYRYPINAYVLGQFIPFLMICLIISWWGMIHNKPLLTYLGMIGLMVRPEVVLIPLIVLIIDNWVLGRRGVVTAWFATILCLWLLTRLMIGSWELDFLEGIISYTGYSFIQWPPLAVGNVWLAIVLACCVVGWGGWMLWRIKSLPADERLPWEISISVLTTLILVPQTNTYTLILALIPVWVTLWASKGSLLDWLLMTLVLFSPWVFYSLREYLSPVYEELLIPLMIAVLLTRRWWIWTGVTRLNKGSRTSATA